ncbi:hypothetical protein NMX13_17635 [Dickeya zeae]|nr:hypothetical protein NMX13_17635 [Dickeya zeae]
MLIALPLLIERISQHLIRNPNETQHGGHRSPIPYFEHTALTSLVIDSAIAPDTAFIPYQHTINVLSMRYQFKRSAMPFQPHNDHINTGNVWLFQTKSVWHIQPGNDTPKAR